MSDEPCAGTAPSTPEAIANRPGLAELAYRTGRWATFRDSMLAGLTAPELAGLRTRSDDDFAIGLLDAWAMAADVLTFATERIAQEHYLGTATERRSIAGLTSLIGYRLAPGVAATAWLAVTLETAPGAPERSEVPAGSAVDTVPGPGEMPQRFETAAPLMAIGAWNRPSVSVFEPGRPSAGDDAVLLAGADVAVRVGERLLFVADDWTFGSGSAQAVRATAVTRGEATTRVTFAPELGAWVDGDAEVSVHALRAQSSLFGHNAPDPRLFDAATRGELALNDGGTDWAFPALGTEAKLAGVHDGAAPGGWALLTRGGSSRVVPVDRVREVSASAHAISARVTSLRFGPDMPSGHLATFGGAATRGTVVAFASEELPLAPVPARGPVAGLRIPLAAPLPGNPEPRRVLIRGATPAGEPVGEVALVEPTTADTVVELLLAEPLTHRYDRAVGLEVLGNVVEATHGRSVRGEVLGSGDGSAAFQRFTLREPWLTHVPAPTATGGASTLEVWVGAIRWREVPSLFGAGPRDRIYVTRIDDDGHTTITFGDGVTGARLPSGTDNVVAHYRVGLGTAGNARAGQITLPLTKPLGLKAVTNPLPATGGRDGQATEHARVNAPRSVLTMGRVVSLQDHADFAADYGELGKASATWTWDGAHRGVLITVAAADGKPLPASSGLLADLRASLREAGDPRTRLEIADFRPASFSLLAQLRVAPDHDPELVRESVARRLLARYAFAARTFGQGVSLSGVTLAMHEVPGVEAVGVDRLHRDDQPASLRGRLEAAEPAPGGPPGAPGAEILTLAPEGITVEVGW